MSRCDTCIALNWLGSDSTIFSLHQQFINVGVKVLARCDNYNASCPFRLCQEASCIHSFLLCVLLHQHVQPLLTLYGWPGYFSKKSSLL